MPLLASKSLGSFTGKGCLLHREHLLFQKSRFKTFKTHPSILPPTVVFPTYHTLLEYCLRLNFQFLLFLRPRNDVKNLWMSGNVHDNALRCNVPDMEQIIAANTKYLCLRSDLDLDM